VAVFNRSSDEPPVILRSPEAWSDRWAWNMSEGLIYFRRT
jgi:hypothetical protein